MRRWNGWGEESDATRLGTAGRRFVASRIGAGSPGRTQHSPTSSPRCRRPGSRPTSCSPPDPEARVRRARGQSFPDLVSLRSGRLDAVPDAVARPADGAEVRRVLDLARELAARVVPWGGGTSVVGGVSVRPSPDPVITADLEGLSGVRSVDERGALVTVGAGTTGPALAAASSRTG